eukprot:UN06203
MGTNAVLKTGSGTESNGLSILDITKHAVRTIINTLDNNDRFSLVSFHTEAKIEIENITMTKNGKSTAEKVLDKLEPLNSTNLWGGLLKGLEVVANGNKKNKNNEFLSSILLLTDGLPNVVPPRGHLPMLKRYKEEHGGKYGCTVNTFGFGYSLDSPLLVDLSVEGNGTYSFIPDASLVGTIFVNTVSNVLSTYATELVVKIEHSNGSKVVDVFGTHPQVDTSWGAQIHMGSLFSGQSKGIVVRMKKKLKEKSEGEKEKIEEDDDETYLCATAEFRPRGTTKLSKLTEEIKGGGTVHEVEIHRRRLEFVTKVAEGMKQAKADDHPKAAATLMRNFVKEIEASELYKWKAKGDQRFLDFIKDISGQAVEAFSKKEYYDKWGKHYLPSLSRAHLLQQCNNFKDPGVQHYGGKVFEKIRDQADKIFLSLPAPKPKVSPVFAQYGGRGASQQKKSYKPVSMSSYYSRSAPCFEGFNTVKMANGSNKLVKDVERGDFVWTKTGKSVVRCVIKTNMPTGKCDLVRLPKSELLLTPWHPVRIKGIWKFPADISCITTQKCDAVYSFVLDSHHVMNINNVECV